MEYTAEKPMNSLFDRLAANRAQFIAASLAVCMIGVSTPALAAGTVAGTPIDNTATATYDAPGGGTVDVDSNTVTIIVDELLDVTVTSADPGDVATSPNAEDQVLSFTVTNTGNGNEQYNLTPDVARGGDDFDPTLVSIVLDTNGNGVYDEGVDTVYTAGTNDPVLAPDESITVFILSDIPAAIDGDRAEVNLQAVADTGTGLPGTSFDGLGDGGGDAVVGTTTASGNDSGFFVIQNAAVALVKSFTIADPFGGTQAVPGSTITYSLVATVTGTSALPGLSISDPIPDDTTYVDESIALEGVALTDTDADAATDAGSYDGTAITVDLGDVPSGQTRSVTFQVTID